MSNDVIIVAAIGMLAAPFASWITWLLNKNKRRNESTRSIAKATSVAVDAIQDVMESLRLDLATAKTDMAEFKIQNQELEKSIRELKEQNEALLKENIKLSEEIDQLREQINRMITDGVN